MSDIFDGSDLMTQVVYGKDQAHGVTTLVVVSGISCVAVVGLILAIAISAFNTRASSDRNLFVRTHVAAYFMSLLCSDLFQAVGSIMNSRWIKDMSVRADNYCVTQGVIKQLADVSTAVWVLIIAIHTFCVLFLQMKLKPYVLWATLVSGWSGIGAIVIAGPATLNTTLRGPFFGVAGYWCWISPGYQTERITLDYMIMFISAFLSFILYSLVFLRLRGNIVVNGWHVRFRLVTAESTATWRGRQTGDGRALIIARQMLLYPIAYTILILPIAAARFSVFFGKNVPFGVTIFCDAIFLFSGTVNVILFTTTRRILPPRSVIGRLVISRPRLLSTSTLESDPDSYYRKDSSLDVEKKIPVHVAIPAPIYETESQDLEKGLESPLPIEHTAPQVQPRRNEMSSPSSEYSYATHARDSSQSAFSLYDAYRGSTYPRESRHVRESTYPSFPRDSVFPRDLEEEFSPVELGPGREGHPRGGSVGHSG